MPQKEMAAAYRKKCPAQQNLLLYGSTLAFGLPDTEVFSGTRLPIARMKKPSAGVVPRALSRSIGGAVVPHDLENKIARASP